MVEFVQHGGTIMSGSGRQVYYPIDQVNYDGKMVGFYYRKSNHFAFHVGGLSDAVKQEIEDAVKAHAEDPTIFSAPPDESVINDIIRFTQSPTMEGDLD